MSCCTRAFRNARQEKDTQETSDAPENRYEKGSGKKARYCALRSPTSTSDPFLLPQNHARETLIRGVRAAFRDAVAAVGITGRLVAHQNRHTYATEMLRSGVGFPALMQLLGHASPEMTLHYLKITQPDLQREYHQALSHPRHLVPSPRALPPSSTARRPAHTLACD
jgi:integrase